MLPGRKVPPRLLSKSTKRGQPEHRLRKSRTFGEVGAHSVRVDNELRQPCNEGSFKTRRRSTRSGTGWRDRRSPGPPRPQRDTQERTSTRRLSVRASKEHRARDSGAKPTSSSRLEEDLLDKNLVVIGYSGRDKSIMEGGLRRGLAQSGDGRLVWCTYEEQEPPEKVLELFRIGRETGREVSLLAGYGFDEILSRLGENVLEDELLDTAEALKETQDDPSSPAPFSSPQGGIDDIVKTNAFPIELPDFMWVFPQTSLAESDDPREKLRRLTEGSPVWAVPGDKEIWALGVRDEICEVLASVGDVSEIHPRRVDEKNFVGDGKTRELLLRTLRQRLVELSSCRTHGRRLIWYPEAPSTHRTRGEELRLYDAARLSLRRFADESFLMVVPTLYVEKADGDAPPHAVRNHVLRTELDDQYNADFSGASDFV